MFAQTMTQRCEGELSDAIRYLELTTANLDAAKQRYEDAKTKVRAAEKELDRQRRLDALEASEIKIP